MASVDDSRSIQYHAKHKARPFPSRRSTLLGTADYLDPNQHHVERGATALRE